MTTSTSAQRVLLTTRQLEAKYGISANTWRYWRSIGTGPAAIVLGKRKVLYDATVVEAWVQAGAENGGGKA